MGDIDHALSASGVSWATLGVELGRGASCTRLVVAQLWCLGDAYDLATVPARPR
jgi:hypothetical protein